MDPERLADGWHGTLNRGAVAGVSGDREHPPDHASTVLHDAQAHPILFGGSPGEPAAVVTYT